MSHQPRSREEKQQLSMIEGSIWRSMIAFAVPIFLGNLFQQFYNAADALIVGNFIGKEALAAVSSSSNLIFMFTGFLNGVAMGAGVLIARFYGAKSYDRLRTAVHTALTFGFIAGVILSVIGVVLSPQILRWMGTPENVLPSSIDYFRTYFYGSTAVFIYNIATGVLQAVGDSRRPLYYLVTASAVNVALDLLFVAVFHWGVGSAAAATVISQVVSMVLVLCRLLRPGQVYQVQVRRLGIEKDTLKQIIRFGLPSGIQNSVISLANVIVQSNINAFGDNAMAGCGSYSRIEGFAFLPVTCFSMALATFVSQNLGARQVDRVKEGARFGILCSTILAEVIGLVIWLGAPQLIGLFNSDPEVLAYGVRQARTIAFFYCFLAFDHCSAGILRGAGRATVPMLIMLVCWCLIRVAYISAMVPIVGDILVVFTAYPVTWALAAVCFVIYLLKVDWLQSADRQLAGLGME